MDRNETLTRALRTLPGHMNHILGDKENQISISEIIELLKDYDHILHLAKAMHTWIFLNVGDEQAVYDELGFSDEDNAMLGSIGRPIVIARGAIEDD